MVLIIVQYFKHDIMHKFMRFVSQNRVISCHQILWSGCVGCGCVVPMGEIFTCVQHVRGYAGVWSPVGEIFTYVQHVRG